MIGTEETKERTLKGEIKNGMKNNYTTTSGYKIKKMADETTWL